MPKKPPASRVEEQAGLRLRAVRLAICGIEGLTQEQFATHIGVTRNAMANWEAGRMPDPRAIVRLFLWQGISLDCIYLGDLRRAPHGLVAAIRRHADQVGTEFEPEHGGTDLPAPFPGTNIVRIRKKLEAGD